MRFQGGCRAALLAACAVGVACAGACRRDEARARRQEAAARATTASADVALDASRAGAEAIEPAGERQRTPGPRRPKLPYREIDRDLARDHPEVCAFLVQFLETCNAGDYSGYRRLVGRSFTPESEDRFNAIYAALEGVRVESIRPVAVPELPPPVHLVVCSVELDPDHRVALRGRSRRIAILIFPEGGQWRMAPAPASLQPAYDAAQAGDAADARKPHFPWDDEPP